MRALPVRQAFQPDNGAEATLNQRFHIQRHHQHGTRRTDEIIATGGPLSALYFLLSRRRRAARPGGNYLKPEVRRLVWLAAAAGTFDPKSGLQLWDSAVELRLSETLRQRTGEV